MTYRSITRDLNVFGFKGRALFTYTEEGKLRNVELYVSRRGSAVFAMYQMAGKLISVGLRRGVSWRKYVEKLREVYNAEPAGHCDLSDKPLESPAEYIALLLEKYYEEPKIQRSNKK